MDYSFIKTSFFFLKSFSERLPDCLEAMRQRWLKAGRGRVHRVSFSTNLNTYHCQLHTSSSGSWKLPNPFSLMKTELQNFKL
jgi:hypothetical protein